MMVEMPARRNELPNSRVSRSPMAKLGTRLAVLVSLIFLVGCDHATKGVAKMALDGGAIRHLIEGVADFRYVENTDIAFNLLRWVPETIRQPGLLVLGAVAIVGLCFLLLQARFQPRLYRWALVLVLAGAVGNYLDRAVRGYVVDFVHVHHWPVFNVADVYVTMGYALLAVGFLIYRRSASGRQARTVR
jgi:signal peptidase II